MIKNTK